jgi:protein-tyrosine phosphatase
VHLNFTEPTRLIGLDRAFNFRDLGGYQSSHGGYVRWRRIFRSDNLASLTDGDHEVLADLSIATVIDLRTPGELERSGKIRPSSAYAYHHLPMADVLPDTTDPNWSSSEFVANRYGEMLTGADACMRTVLSIAADPRSYPLVFHCAVGKDRTGIVSLVILGLLGVSREDIVADYVRTQAAMERMVAALTKNSPERARQIEPHLPAIFATQAGNMSGLMRMIDDRYGSIEEYSRHIGAAESVSGLRENLLAELR